MPATLYYTADMVRELTDEEARVGHVFCSPADISWGPDSLVQPDVFAVPLEQAGTLDWRQVDNLLLAIEVLSPSSIRADHFTKRRLYQEVGVPLYWVVDADARIAEVWAPSDRFPRLEREALLWAPAYAAAPFAMRLDELFRPI